MKTYFLTAFCALGLTFSVQAQQLEPKKQSGILSVQQPQPLVLVNQQETAAHAFILNPTDIKSMDVVKGASALERFGEKGKNGVVLMELKQQLPLARLQEVYRAFNVPTEQQKLTLAINGAHLQDPALLLADLRQIEKVELTEFETAPSRWSYDEQFLNIITKAQN